eukprot:SAG31_NODE_1917_length_6923_cov_8.914897_7_plen_91_part_00
MGKGTKFNEETAAGDAITITNESTLVGACISALGSGRPRCNVLSYNAELTQSGGRDAANNNGAGAYIDLLKVSLFWRSMVFAYADQLQLK